MTVQNPYWSLLKTAWYYAKEERSRYALIYVLFLGSNLVFAIEPIIWGWFVSALQREGTDVLYETGWYVAAYLGLRLGDWVFHGPARVMECELAFRLGRTYLDELYHKVLALPLRWHQDHHSGDTINRVRKAAEALREFFESGFMYLHAFAKFVLSFAAMIWFSPLFGGIGVVLGLFTVWAIMRFDRPLIKYIDEVNEKEHAVSSTLFDTLSNIVTVITLRLEARLQKGLYQKVSDIFPPFRKKTRINEWKWFVADMLVAVIYVVVIAGYVWQIRVPGQVLELGGLVMLTAYVTRFTSAFHDVAWQYNEIVRLNTNLQTARFIFDAYDSQHRPEATKPLPDNWRMLGIDHLSYQHQVVAAEPDSDKPIPGLHDIRIRLAKGQRVALVGESGCGKSTLLTLLRGLFPIRPEAHLSIDNQPWADWGAVADTVTLFPQEPEIFENTIRYNITLGLPFTDEEIMAVCDTAHFSEVVTQLPKGLDSSIMEKGVNLSGGQKQRLALARGILAARASAIVLLDEPTSSVDPKTELLIYDRLFSEFSDKAIVSALHRLHLLTKFDYVYVMANGRIVEEGTFEALKANGPVFGELWQHQQEETVDG
jgi:ATP-binding cassette, subfamily B, bacterial